jgi:hypothetical protein
MIPVIIDIGAVLNNTTPGMKLDCDYTSLIPCSDNNVYVHLPLSDSQHESLFRDPA